MKRRSGNGYNGVQYIYVLLNLPYFWVCKIGIGGNLKRTKQVDRSSPGKDFVIFAWRIPFAYQVEQFLHRLFWLFRIRFGGSGHTERFWSIVAPFAVAVVLLVAVLEVVILCGAVWLFWVIFSQFNS